MFIYLKTVTEKYRYVTSNATVGICVVLLFPDDLAVNNKFPRSVNLFATTQKGG